MLHIKEPGINLKKDSKFLNESYHCLLDYLSNNKLWNLSSNHW